MTTSSVAIDETTDTAGIMGAIRGDPNWSPLNDSGYHVVEGRLYVEGVEQAVLDLALASHGQRRPTADDVRAEASRRMQVIVGARDAAHLEIIIANATREAVRLLKLGEENWTPEEAARAFERETVDAMIEHIRYRSNAMEGDPPVDFTDDERWV